jgi:hypothetical protein
MRCPEIVVELDSYLTGELDPDLRAEVQRHIQECAACRAEVELVRRENTVFREYAAAAEARPNSEDGIPGASRCPKRAFNWMRWAAAAAVLVLAVLSWCIFVGRHPSEVRENAETETSAPINQAIASYEQALDLLQTSYQAKRANLDPALVLEVDRNLRITETAAAECKSALKQSPNNPQLIEFLMLDYGKQIGILRQITEVL